MSMFDFCKCIVITHDRTWTGIDPLIRRGICINLHGHCHHNPDSNWEPGDIANPVAQSHNAITFPCVTITPLWRFFQSVIMLQMQCCCWQILLVRARIELTSSGPRPEMLPLHHLTICVSAELVIETRSSDRQSEMLTIAPFGPNKCVSEKWFWSTDL